MGSLLKMTGSGHISEFGMTPRLQISLQMLAVARMLLCLPLLLSYIDLISESMFFVSGFFFFFLATPRHVEILRPGMEFALGL